MNNFYKSSQNFMFTLIHTTSPNLTLLLSVNITSPQGIPRCNHGQSSHHRPFQKLLRGTVPAVPEELLLTVRVRQPLSHRHVVRELYPGLRAVRGQRSPPGVTPLVWGAHRGQSSHRRLAVRRKRIEVNHERTTATGLGRNEL